MSTIILDSPRANRADLSHAESPRSDISSLSLGGLNENRPSPVSAIASKAIANFHPSSAVLVSSISLEPANSSPLDDVIDDYHKKARSLSLVQFQEAGAKYVDEIGKHLEKIRLANPHAYKKEMQKCLDAFETAKEIRRAYWEANAMPVYTPQIGELPRYRMTSLQQFDDAAKIMGIPVEEGIETITDVEPTEGMCDEAVQSFAAQKDLFPWQAGYDGCYARAAFMGHQMLLRGVPEANVGKIFFVYPEGRGWHYHVATSITLPDGRIRVLDPYISDKCSVTIDAWLNAQQKLSSPVTPIQVTEETQLPYVGDEYRAYLIPHNMILRVVKPNPQEGRKLKFERETPEIVKGTIERLCDLRVEQENRDCETLATIFMFDVMRPQIQKQLKTIAALADDASLSRAAFRQAFIPTAMAIKTMQKAHPAAYSIASENFETALEALQKSRKAYETAHCMPIYTIRLGELPAYRLVPLKEYHTATKLFSNGIPVESGTTDQPVAQINVTPEQLDDVVKAFASDPFLCWDDHDSDTHARLSIMTNQLRLMGIPAEHINKGHILGYLRQRKVLLVRTQTEDGSPINKIIDLRANKKRALTEEEWQKIIKLDQVHKHVLIEEPKTLDIEGYSSTCFWTKHDVIIKEAEGGLLFERESETTTEEALKQLRQSRWDRDKALIALEDQAVSRAAALDASHSESEAEIRRATVSDNPNTTNAQAATALTPQQEPRSSAVKVSRCWRIVGFFQSSASALASFVLRRH